MAGHSWKPYIQSLYIDLVKGKGISPTPIHLGFRSSSDYLLDYLKDLQEVGVNHCILNLKFSSLPVSETLGIIEKDIVGELNKW